MRDRLDEIDRRIIASLQVSARRKNVEIAAELGLAESTVRRRVEKLLAGDFVRVVAVADPLKSGYPVVAIIGLECAPSALSNVEKELLRLDEFRFIGMTSGSYNFIAEAWFTSLAELQTFITERLSSIKEIERIETTHVLKMVRYMYDWGHISAPAGDGTAVE